MHSGSLTTTSIHISELDVIPAFATLPLRVKEWLIEKGGLRTGKAGENMFSTGENVDEMIAILAGKVQLTTGEGSKSRILAQMTAGTITGVLPMSRMQKATATGVIVEDLRVYTLHKKHFAELEFTSPELFQALVGIMANRIREFSLTAGQEERLTALGKLAAGLAHELNNPVAAMQRSAAQLQTEQARALRLLPNALQALPLDAWHSLTTSINQLASEDLPLLDPIDQADAEEELETHLRNIGIDAANSLAATLVSEGLLLGHMQQLAQAVPQKQLPAPVLLWAVASLQSQRMARRMQFAAERIASVVESVKAFSNMDRAADWQQESLNHVVERTLLMLRTEAENKGISLQLQLQQDLPEAHLLAGEINQLVFQLVENAIYFTPPGKLLRIATHVQGVFVQLDVANEGPEIPAEALPRIFDAFFTTKPQGEGTGLGLSIARRIALQHHGSLQAERRGHETVFTFCMPLSV